VTETTGTGKNTQTQRDIAIVRLLDTGQLDTSFGQGGKVITSISTSTDSSGWNKYDNAEAVAIQADGKIVVAGETYNGSASSLDSVLIRYHTDGSLDTGFGQAGIVVTSWSTSVDQYFDLEIQGDGRIVVAGNPHPDGSGGYPYFVARYNANGSLDDGSIND